MRLATAVLTVLIVFAGLAHATMTFGLSIAASQYFVQYLVAWLIFAGLWVAAWRLLERILGIQPEESA